jgi:endonuclease I
VTRYPELRDAIFDKVIDMASLLLWHHTNKISRFELELDDMIYKTQGRRNVYVRDPVKLVKDVAECQKKGKCIFERFDYDDHFDVV